MLQYNVLSLNTVSNEKHFYILTQMFDHALYTKSYLIAFYNHENFRIGNQY